MARNGSGTYNLLTNSWNPATNGVSATAVDWQNLINDVAAALTQSLSADGQTPITGNLNAGNNKITGLAAGTTAGDSLRWEQLFSQGQPANLASAATTDIGAQNTVLLNITGTTTITSFGTNYNGPRYLRFDGVLTLTHNATTLILPSGVNITTAAGDSAIVVPNGTPANGWRVLWYQRADGAIDIVSSGVPIRVASTNSSGYGLISYGRAATATNNWHVGSEGDGTFRFYNGNFGFGTERMRIDSSGNVLVTNNTGGIGYGTGAGGTVTQTTSKSTAVTLNRPSGIIVMNNASLAAGASVTFEVNNGLLFVGNWLVLVSTDFVNYRVSVDSVSGGKFVVRVTNSNVIPLADDVNVKFALIRVSST